MSICNNEIVLSQFSRGTVMFAVIMIWVSAWKELILMATFFCVTLRFHA